MVQKVRVSKALRAVLAVLVEAGDALYGTEVIRRTKLLPGTVYPLLIRLRGSGWLRSVTESDEPAELGRPVRTYYELTKEGAAEAARILGLESRTQQAA